MQPEKLYALWKEEDDTHDVGTHADLAEIFTDRATTEFVAEKMKELGMRHWDHGRVRVEPWRDWWVTEIPVRRERVAAHSEAEWPDSKPDDFEVTSNNDMELCCPASGRKHKLDCDIAIFSGTRLGMLRDLAEHHLAEHHDRSRA